MTRNVLQTLLLASARQRSLMQLVVVNLERTIVTLGQVERGDLLECGASTDNSINACEDRNKTICCNAVAIQVVV